jgi:hypothetical protein
LHPRKNKDRELESWEEDSLPKRGREILFLLHPNQRKRERAAKEPVETEREEEKPREWDDLPPLFSDRKTEQRRRRLDAAVGQNKDIWREWLFLENIRESFPLFWVAVWGWEDLEELKRK